MKKEEEILVSLREVATGCETYGIAYGGGEARGGA
jgi:hypothetical protein